MDKETMKINKNDADISLLNNTIQMLAIDLDKKLTFQWYKSHNILLAAAMNHLDIVIENVNSQVFGIKPARKGIFYLAIVDLPLLRRGKRQLEKKAIMAGFKD